MKEKCNKRTSLSDSEPNFKFIIIFKCAIEEFNKQMYYNCFNGLICFYLNKRAKGKLKIDCIMYSNEFGELAKSKEAQEWFTLLEQEQEQQI